jgi:hypothetical protein
MGKRLKTEHNGAKNGGGAWCKRVVAKAESRKLRRENAKDDIRAALREPPVMPEEIDYAAGH